MQWEEGVTKVRELGNRMVEHSEAAERASLTYKATMELFNVAAMSSDEKAMQVHRDTLHTTVDIILDSGAMIQQLQRQMKTVCNQVTEFPKKYDF